MLNLEIIDEFVKEILLPSSLRVFEKLPGTQLFFPKAHREREEPREKEDFFLKFLLIEK